METTQTKTFFRVIVSGPELKGNSVRVSSSIVVQKNRKVGNSQLKKTIGTFFPKNREIGETFN